ncbi:MAG: hypothetical protein IH953_11445 [Chloroflexi bacterium]|nr:hypothetical protein [Chloroflexota bacterium]
MLGRVWNKLLDFLGHPAWRGIRTIFIIWGVISGTLLAIAVALAAILPKVEAYLTEEVSTTRYVFWILIFGSPLVTLFLTFAIDRLFRKREPEVIDPSDLDYRIEHGVAWRWPASPIADNRRKYWNPKCLEHKITVNVQKVHDPPDGRSPIQIYFYCRGTSLESAHQIEGPFQNELKNGDLFDDTYDRIQGKILLGS